MENILEHSTSEIIFGTSDSLLSQKISKLVKEGIIRKIAPRLYTTNLMDGSDVIIKRNLFLILGTLYPGAVLSHRSAIEFKPTKHGSLYMTYKYTKKVNLPGIKLKFLKGSGPIAGDNTISGNLYVSQKERAILENLQSARISNNESKNLPISAIEGQLEKIILTHGEKGLNEFRERSKNISIELNLNKEYKKLNRIISALLTTHPSKILESKIAKARAMGMPFDQSRIDLFEILFQELINNEFAKREEKNTTEASFRNFAFFESYFSNYIEGTEFGLEEAKEIIDTNTPKLTRNADSHDIMATFEITSSLKEMQITPRNPEEFIAILLKRHRILLRSRIEKSPGTFKHKNNFAGSTAFVDYKLVVGTLVKSMEYYNALSNAFSKAVYMMFVISEIHPFLDGNGRIARIMMNAELTSSSISKIIIPTVYRDDYLISLRKLTRKREPMAYLNMISTAHQFSSNIIGNDINDMQKYLEKCHAFKESDEGRLLISE